MTSGIKIAAVAIAAIVLAPIVIFARPHSGGPVAYVVPLIVFPVPALLAGAWPSPWSAATAVGFAVAVGVVWLGMWRARNRQWWRSALPLAMLSLAGSALVIASFVMVGSGVIALIWSGLASALWNLLLLSQVRSVRPGLGQAALCLWLLGGIGFSLFGALFGLMSGLCC